MIGAPDAPRRHRLVEAVAGIILVGAGILDLASNWDNLRLAFGA